MRHLIISVALLGAACSEDSAGSADDGGTGACVDVSTWAQECFAEELAGEVTGRGWGHPVPLRLRGDGARYALLGGTFGEIKTVLGTCRTEYFCGGNSVELSIKGADTTHAWSGALRQLEVVRPAEQGPALERSAEWNLGRADLPYEGCVSLCFSDGATCGLDGCGGSCGRCGRGLDCDPDTRECVPDGLCRSDADCDGGLRCDTFIGACLDPNACVDSGPCGSTPCCAGSTCVAIDGQAECRTNCLGAAACASGCCLPLQSGAGSICAPAALCDGCANSNEPCSPIDNPCCPGMACIFVDGVGARCQTQSAACPAGCRNPAGSTCCRPPFCDGACRGSPCCQ